MTTNENPADRWILIFRYRYENLGDEASHVQHSISSNNQKLKPLIEFDPLIIVQELASELVSCFKNKSYFLKEIGKAIQV